MTASLRRRMSQVERSNQSSQQKDKAQRQPRRALTAMVCSFSPLMILNHARSIVAIRMLARLSVALAAVGTVGTSLGCSPPPSSPSPAISSAQVVTYDDYLHLRRGMPLTALQAAIGHAGDVIAQRDGYAVIRWQNSDGSFLLVQFLEGRASSWRHKGLAPE
jgi:hypothetical protein